MAITMFPHPWALHHRTVVRRGLAGGQALMAAAAAWGAFLLATEAWDLDPGFEEHLPFSNWPLAGAALFLLVAVPQMTSAVLLALDHPRAAAVALATGLALMAWIVAEVAIMWMFHPVMQPLVFAWGAAEALLARELPRRS